MGLPFDGKGLKGEGLLEAVHMEFRGLRRPVSSVATRNRGYDPQPPMGFRD